MRDEKIRRRGNLGEREREREEEEEGKGGEGNLLTGTIETKDAANGIVQVATATD